MPVFRKEFAADKKNCLLETSKHDIVDMRGLREKAGHSFGLRAKLEDTEYGESECGDQKPSRSSPSAGRDFV